MELLNGLLILVIVGVVAAVVGHAIARRTRMTRMRIWRRRASLAEHEAEDPDLDEYLAEPFERVSDLYHSQADDLEEQARLEHLKAERLEAEVRRLRQAAEDSDAEEAR
jgi:hypothetical protein